MTNKDDMNNAPFPQLSPHDKRLLDRLVEADFDFDSLADLSTDDRDRAETMCRLVELMNDYPVDDGDESLVDATLARITRAEQHRSEQMNFEAQAVQRDARRLRFFRMPDLISVAAAILVVVGVGWPILSSMRQRSIDTACANNMRQMAYAFGQYANDFGGSLPVEVATQQAGTWDTLSHVLNLGPLIQNGYCESGHLLCPGHESLPGPSYSYRWFMPGHSVGWEVGRVTVVLGDLNPVVDAARSGRFVPPLSMTINHAGRGQNVLASDGATMWLVQPVVGRQDNIWLPEGRDRLRRGDEPNDPMDVFLVH